MSHTIKLASKNLERLLVYGPKIFTREDRAKYWHETVLTLMKVLENEIHSRGARR